MWVSAQARGAAAPWRNVDEAGPQASSLSGWEHGWGTGLAESLTPQPKDGGSFGPEVGPALGGSEPGLSAAGRQLGASLPPGWRWRHGHRI